MVSVIRLLCCCQRLTTGCCRNVRLEENLGGSLQCDRATFDNRLLSVFVELHFCIAAV